MPNYLPTKWEDNLLFWGDNVAGHMGDDKPNLAAVKCNKNRVFVGEKIRHNFERKTQQLLCVTQEKTLATLLLSLAEIHNSERRVSLLFCELNNSTPVLRTAVFLVCQTTHLL